LNYYNYFTEIEDTFIRRRGKSLFLSPLDWALIETWQERKIPLHIVLRSIESVFDVYDKQPEGTRTIKTLFYCREEVEVQHTEWSRSQVGKAVEDAAVEDAMFSVGGIREHIEKAILELRSIADPGLQEEIGRAVTRLEELCGNLGDDFERIDKTLGDIEKLLDRGLLSNWQKPHLKLLEKEIAGQLKVYKAEMEPDAYKQTFDLMLLKRLREEAGVPRLGLFYL
jgi:hypothetical protein